MISQNRELVMTNVLPPDQFSRNSYVDDKSCLLVSSLLLYFTR
jgi:hypothetical protein